MKYVLKTLAIASALMVTASGCNKIFQSGKVVTETSQTKGASDDQPTRLRVTNSCDQPLWIDHGMGNKSEKLPGNVGNRRLNPGESLDLPLPAGRVEAMRVWPKIGCDENGMNCDIGESMAPCGPSGCQPPIESKFEATFADANTCGDKKDAQCVTWYNASQVDGYTLSYAVYPKGNLEGVNGCEVSRCDIDVNSCPSDELIGGQLFDLKVRGKNTGRVVGCMAPCKKLNYPAPWGAGMDERQAPADYMCCPEGISSEACRAGPIERTKYVAHIRNVCKNVYTYSYDDLNGLHTCSATTKFEVVFCPKGGPAAGVLVGPGSNPPPAPTPNPTPNPTPTPTPTPPPATGNVCDTDARVNHSLPYRYDESCRTSGGAGCIADLPCRYNQ